MNFLIILIFISVLVAGYCIYNKQRTVAINRQKAINEMPVFKLFQMPIFNSNFKLQLHSQNLKKAITTNNIKLANLTYAKIIELVRQENFANSDEFASILKDLKKEYKEFRKEFDLEYPENFLSPWERNRINNGFSDDDFDPKYERILEIHFDLDLKISNYYKNREVDFNLEKAIESCNEQIKIAEQAKYAFEVFYQNESLPYHRGFSQLAIILEKQNKFYECVQLCKTGKVQGWDDDWDKRIDRLNKKIKSALLHL